MLIIQTTVSTTEDAESLARKLVEGRLAACVQIIPQIVSVFEWNGSIEREAELLLVIKTTDDKWPELEAFIREHHPYETPELVAVRAERVSNDYLVWLESILGPSRLRDHSS